MIARRRGRVSEGGLRAAAASRLARKAPMLPPLRAALLLLLARQAAPIPLAEDEATEAAVALPEQVLRTQLAGRALQAGAGPVAPECLQLRDGSNVRCLPPPRPSTVRLHSRCHPYN